MADFFSSLLSNPVVVGAAVRAVLDQVPALLKKVDASGLAAKYNQFLNPLLLVVTFLVSALDLFVKGHLQDLNLEAVSSFINVYLPMVLGGKAMGVVAKPKEEVKK